MSTLQKLRDDYDYIRNLIDLQVGSQWMRYSGFGNIEGSHGKVSLERYPEIVEYIPKLLELIAWMDCELTIHDYDD